MVEGHGDASTGSDPRSGRSTSDPDVQLAELRADLSIEDLRRRRSRTERARSEIRIEDVLAGSLHLRVDVLVASGARITGSLVEIGSDYICLQCEPGAVWIRSGAVQAVATPHDPASRVGSSGAISASLPQVLEDLMLSERELMVGLNSGERIVGLPIAVGSVLTLRGVDGYTVVTLNEVATISQVKPTSL